MRESLFKVPSIFRRPSSSLTTAPLSAPGEEFGGGKTLDIETRFSLADPDEEVDQDAAALVDPESGTDPDAVHDVLKRTDVWFAINATALEKGAVDLAARHAEKGQPRHDLHRDGPLEMEVMLEQQAREILWNWGDRVKRKMQGAVSFEIERIGNNLAAARQAVANAGAARDAMDRQRQRIAQHTTEALLAASNRRDDGTEEPATVESERHMPDLWFWPLMVLLVLADFFANVPVFTELFPANKLVDDAFSQWEEGILSQGDLPTWFGLAHLLKRVAIYPESAILAVSVVILFVFLGHQAGGALRSLVVLWKHRSRDATHAIANSWRQAWWPAALSLSGVIVMIGVLFFARSGVLPMANQRVEAARAEIAATQTEIATLEESGALVPGEMFDRIGNAQEELRMREQRVDYARSIAGMNWPIAFLNMVLVIAAIVAGYLREKRRFSTASQLAMLEREEQGRRLGEMNGALAALYADFSSRRHAAHEALGVVRQSIVRAEHLLKTDLLRDWYGKSERLRRAVPLFRTENARLRGLDVEDILAFRTPVTMALPSAGDLGVSLEEPPALISCREDHHLLQARVTDLDHVTLGDAVPALAIYPSANGGAERHSPLVGA